MSSLTIRQAVMADLEGLAALFDLYRQFQGRASDVVAARAFLRERFDHGDAVAFIAQDANAFAGFAQLYPSYSSISLTRIFVLNDLFVSSIYRRRRVGSRLLTAVEEYAWAQGAVRVTLNVARDNAAGRALYAAEGWSEDKEYVMLHRFPRLEGRA